MNVERPVKVGQAVWMQTRLGVLSAEVRHIVGEIYTCQFGDPPRVTTLHRKHVHVKFSDAKAAPVPPPGACPATQDWDPPATAEETGR